MNSLNTLRLRHGLRWRGTRPGLAELRRLAHGILAVAILLLMYGFTDALAEATDRAIAAEQAADIGLAHAKAMQACEAGASGYYYSDGRAFQCGGKL